MQQPRPYRSPARKAESARTRDRVLAAATALLRAPEGAQRCTLEAVAKAAGVTRLTVYNLFGSRSLLFEAVFDECARRGGLVHIAGAMSNSDPQSAIEQLIAIFVAFWASDQNALGNLYALGSNDPDFRAVLGARNERRHHAFSVLVARLIDRGDIATDAAGDVVDALFALTSYAFFADLTGHGRSPNDARVNVLELAHAALSRARGGVKRCVRP